ncbi:MAG: MATE family efflux transporter [Stygiobacter sp. RIFOXYC12_FULL_38_8]|nr:MAG: MATE family efflux transporter [Stygiobacter sp. RIFOXYB2_FULL_37_11]OGV11107.1 MAG: MATE family efflux transporter [Stygiobacter sp. RIFOXYA2_FULL_38_8]OGV16086.1 MAG: MATE family efflux transporter [Stygiobacter sp. RIFOXYC2_FULL_38_25]OGV23828.1 MAG: MATE family efflux transporter [Stygiobacter sp. RIFOXYC12_FULL_38_8]OGV80961.1 MAG: MATE family efflux transporter [Stygiobacter sp. GWF2_38_21]
MKKTLQIKEHIKETVKLAIPISFGQLGHVMMGVVDSMMVGRIGTAQLAASALVNGLFFLVLVIGIGVSMAATPLISMAKGAQKFDDCGKTLSHSLVVNFSFSIILTVLTFGMTYVIPHLNQPKEVVAEAIPFMQVLSFSVIPFMLFQSYRQFLEGLSIPNPPMVIVLLANLLNAFLNWIFIYGNFGAPSLGLFGSGISTTVTRWIMAFALILFVINYKKVKQYNPRISISSLDISLIRKLISIGLPSGFQYFLEVGAFGFAAIMIGWIGSHQLAAHQIAINLASITYMIILGISAAGTIRVGGFLGENNWIKVRYAGFTSLGISVAIMFCFGISFIIFKTTLTKFYVNDSEVISIASQLLIVAALFQIFDGMQATGVGILRGLSDVKVPLVISLFAYWIIGIPVGALLGFYFKLGAVGVWIGLLIGLALIGITLLFRFRYKTKHH